MVPHIPGKDCCSEEMMGREAFHWTPIQTGIREDVKHEGIVYYTHICIMTFQLNFDVFYTHCEIDGHHEADLATSSDIVNKTESGDCSAGRYKLLV